MIGSRVSPIQVANLFHRVVNYINERRKSPYKKPYYTKVGGRRYSDVYDDTQIWCRDFATYITDVNDFERLLNDIADCQAMSILNAIKEFDKEIYVPCIGVFSISGGTYNVLKEKNFNVNEVLHLDQKEFRAIHKAFHDRLKKERFYKTTDKAKYYESRTSRLADILRRRET